VLVIDRRGRASSTGREHLLLAPSDVASAANWLSARGVRRILLLGSSLGTLGAFIAASPDGPQVAVTPHNPAAAILSAQPCGVVLVSPLESIDSDGGRLDSLAVKGFTARLWIAYETGHADIVRDAKAVAGTATTGGGTVVRSLAVDTSDHSLQLVRNHANVRTLLDEAVQACS
jgi:pimeloyl-ACP methyl ester carboxylesterase